MGVRCVSSITQSSLNFWHRHTHIVNAYTYVFMSVYVHMCIEGIIGNAMLRQRSIDSRFDILVNGLHVFIHMFFGIVCMESFMGAQRTASRFDHEQCTCLSFICLMFCHGLYLYIKIFFVLKLCLCSAIWAMCRGLGLNGFDVLPWHIYRYMYVLESLMGNVQA